MAFLIRMVSRTADGREIVRSATLDRDRVSVGRAPDCDIHLADLAVALEHAVIRHEHARRIVIEATAGLPFDIDGRQTMRGEIDPGRGGTIRLGAHAITVSRDREGGDADIILTVERVGALSEVSEGEKDDRSFALSAVLPGKRVTAWALAMAVVLVFLAWPVSTYFASKGVAQRPIGVHGDSLWSSGPLSGAHATLENDCQACHVKAFEAVRDQACMSCHKQVHDHADSVRLAAAKGALPIMRRIGDTVAATFNAPPGRCVACHVEHQGKTAAISPTGQAFCSDCHADLRRALPDTSLADAADFGDNHPQFRPAIDTGAGIFQRMSLDSHPIEDSGLKFPHRLHLSRTNGVARMAQTLSGEQGFGKSLACRDCHVPDAGGISFKPVTMEGNCQMCHSLVFDKTGGVIRTLRHGEPAQVVAELRDFYAVNRPTIPFGFGTVQRHRPGDGLVRKTAFDFVTAAPGGAARAIQTVFGKDGICSECHLVTPASAPGRLDFGVVPVKLSVRYFLKGKFDHAAHDTEKCESCHAAPASNSASDVLLPGVATCRQCHGGEEAHKQVPSGCAMCHDYHVGKTVPLITADTRRFRQ